MDKINWGIIGCGNVTEVKSGPAFNKVKDSALVAVMRRDADKAKDYAARHNVSRWYDDATKLINDAEVNAIYIATPPASHEIYCIEAINAGKHVYVEKPMALNFDSAQRIAQAARNKNIKLVVAHYRREQPFFKKVKQLIDEGSIGDVRLANLIFYKPSLTTAELAVPGYAWRVDPALSGGGLFHDLAPHQLDLMYYFFGKPKKIKGISVNQEGRYSADDIVAGSILFDSNIVFNGTWCFNAAEGSGIDRCEIIGSTGKIVFSVFNNTLIEVINKEGTSSFPFEMLQHVQQPMIEKVVQYFLGNASNPCTAGDGATVMSMIDAFVSK